MMDSGETAKAAPKGKRRTLRQKNRILDETLESDSTDEAKSFRYKDRAHEHFFVRALFLMSGPWIGACIQTGHLQKKRTVQPGRWYGFGGRSRDKCRVYGCARDEK